MVEASRSGMSTTELLGASWRLWRSHAGMFVMLMGIPIAALLLIALTVNYVIAPHPEDTPLREVWLGMGFLQKVAVFVAFLGSLAMQYRALAASVFATQEIRSGRSVGILRAIGAVRRKQLRLFWMVMLANVYRAVGIDCIPAPCIWHCASFSSGDTGKYDGLCRDQTW